MTGSDGTAQPDEVPEYDLERFVEAQRNVYDGCLAELRRGRKTGHWIWFIFPQLMPGWAPAPCRSATPSPRWMRRAPTRPIRCSARDCASAPRRCWRRGASARWRSWARSMR